MRLTKKQNSIKKDHTEKNALIRSQDKKNYNGYEIIWIKLPGKKFNVMRTLGFLTSCLILRLSSNSPLKSKDKWVTGIVFSEIEVGYMYKFLRIRNHRVNSYST